MAHLIVTAGMNFLLGMSLGMVGGLLGIGGGLIAIPILTYLYGMDQHLAQGTALVMIAPNVMIAFWRYYQKSRIDLRSVAAMSIFAMLAAYLSARYVAQVDDHHLHIAFAVFLIGLALYFGWQIKGESCTVAAPVNARDAMPMHALPILGTISGSMSGIFTVGGSLVVVPALVSLFGMAQTRAQGMALALVLPGALIALGTYAQAGQVGWDIGIPLAFGGVISVSWGVTLAHQFSPIRLRALFCMVLLATALMMLWSK